MTTANDVVQQWKDELRAAGWEQKGATVWQSPQGHFYRGPHKAWLVMSEQKRVDTSSDANLKKLAEQYSEKYPYPDVDEWVQFGEMVLFANKLSEKDAQQKLDAAWNEIQCCDDVRLDQGLAVAIADLQKLRMSAEADAALYRNMTTPKEAKNAL